MLLININYRTYYYLTFYLQSFNWETFLWYNIYIFHNYEIIIVKRL